MIALLDVNLREVQPRTVMLRVEVYFGLVQFLRGTKISTSFRDQGAIVAEFQIQRGEGFDPIELGAGAIDETLLVGGAP